MFGLMRVTRAAIPVMRRQGSGTIVQVSSMGGRVTFPLYSIYHATKWAVEGFSESLAFELRPFGIRIRLVEPGAVRTEFYGRSWRLRYPVAPPAPLLMALRKVLPEAWFLRLIRNRYGIRGRN